MAPGESMNAGRLSTHTLTVLWPSWLWINILSLTALVLLFRGFHNRPMVHR